MSVSLFEIIGPVMVGPSSSHTAGMARIGMTAYRIAAFSPRQITLKLSPSLRTTYRGHRTDAALVGGALGWREDDSRLRDAIVLAEKSGVSVSVAFLPPNRYHPNTAQIEMSSDSGEFVCVRGVSVGGGSLYIDAIDGAEIRLLPEKYHLIVWGPGAESAMDAVHADTADTAIQKSDRVCAASFPGNPGDGLAERIRRLEGVEKVRLVEPVLAFGATISEKLRLTSTTEALTQCRLTGISLSELALRYECDRSGFSRERVRETMLRELGVMKESVRCGLEQKNALLYGLTSGEDARRLMAVCRAGKTISGGIVPEAMARALGVMELNASMGCVVAAPTAGSAGIVPGCMTALQENCGFTDERITDALFVCALFGVIMAHRNVSFSGAVGGCQGEVGVSGAIAAAGIASLFSADPDVAANAMAICLKSILGLVCDPVAGPVEVPCIKRNAVGVANAFAAADMACAGIASYVSPDQVIEALIDVQRRLPKELRGTTVGGLACTEQAKKLRRRLEQEAGLRPEIEETTD